MSDAHPVRNGIIATTVGGLLVALILWIAGFVGIVWRGLGSAISWLWHHLTASISLPTWLVIVALVYAVGVTVRLRKRRTPPSLPSVEQPSSLRGGAHVAPRELDRLQVKVMRAMANADGATQTIDELADDLGMSRLRVEQALEELEGMGYLEVVRDVVNGPAVDVTRAGRDYLIAKGLV